MLSSILRDVSCREILLEIGIPVVHRNVRYNCRIIYFNGDRPLFVQTWQKAAIIGMRFFAPWGRPCDTELFCLSRMIQDIVGERSTIIGDALISCEDTVVGCETCEGLFTPNAPHVQTSLDGNEIFTNSSGSVTNAL